MASPFPWHTQEIDSIAHELKTDLERGLTNKEAASRLDIYGLNKLPEKEGIPWLDILLRQHISLMIPLVLLVSVILALMGVLSGAAIVMCLLIVNVIFSVFQEVKSERLLRTLRVLASNSAYAKVLRNGYVSPVKATDLVPGDIMCFETGHQITADGRLIEAELLTVDESVFNETNEPIEKDVAVLGEDVPLYPVHLRGNMVFMGTMVASGSGRAIVTATGSQTQIAQMSLERSNRVMKFGKSERWLLETNLSKNGLWFVGGCIVSSAIIWVLTMVFGMTLVAGAMVSLSFLLAIWPLCLVESVRMALTVGMKRLSENHIIIRRFPGAEALASATAICSNKTGVMTQNLMTVRKVFVDGRIMDVEGDGYDPESGGFPPNAEEDNPDLPVLLSIAAMCTHTEVKNTPEGWSVIGDPAEGALIIAAMKGGINKDELGLSITKLVELPFDPERKRESAIFKSTDDEFYIFMKGSLEAVLGISTSIQLHGHINNLDVGKQHAIRAVNQSFSREGMRSLAFAYCQLKDVPKYYTVGALERNLIFVGLIGMYDPPRADVVSAVKKCLSSGVEAIMFTDDHADTAFAFAQDIGIAQEETSVLTGEDLEILSDEGYSNLAEKFSIYADILPDHKLRVVRALKEKGKITAVIGSEASDAPAIGEADIGIAASPTSPSITINSSDMVLVDSSFATAINAIEVMRGAYGNVKRLVRYFLSGDMAIACTILIALIISIFWKKPFSIPFLSLHIPLIYVLWIKLLAVSLPAFAIAFNPVNAKHKLEGPYPCGSIFNSELKGRILVRGILATVLAIVGYVFSWGFSGNQTQAMTSVLTVLVMSQLAFAFQCCRAPDESFLRNFFANKLLLGLFTLGILLHLTILYIQPVSRIFGTVPLSLLQWAPSIVAFIICLIPLDELFITYLRRSRTAIEEETELVEEDTQANSDGSSDETMNQSS